MKYSNYDNFYNKGGFNYHLNKNHHAKWIFNHTTLKNYDNNTTLLDVGCGDGFWSIILSKKFKVTGIDLSMEGIRQANKKIKNKKDINFIMGDVLKHNGVYDILLCRAPTILNLPSKDKKFKENIKVLMGMCKKELIYIQSTKAPYERWSNPSTFFNNKCDEEYFNSKWYYHDPTELKNNLSIFGLVNVIIKNGYIIANIKKI